MSDRIPALLEPIQERLNAATPGPWEPMRAGLLGTRVVAIDGEWGEEIIPPEFIHMVTPAMRNYETAVFIAAAPTDTARLLAAVKAVVELHVPVDVYEIDPVNGTWIYEGDERKVLVRLCQACTPAFVLDDLDEGEYDGGGSDADVAWPCPTVSAVEAALRGEA